MEASTKGYYKYLSYVTMREAWEVSKTYFWVWVFFSVFSVVIGGIFEVGADAVKNGTGIASDTFPQWFLGAAVFAGIAWFCKGEEIKFKFPTLTFKSWALLALAIFIMAFVFANSPWWATAPFYFAIIVIGTVVDDLAEKGKDNFMKLKGNEDGGTIYTDD